MKTLVIFGASGDLAKRKLFPAISKLDLSNIRVFAYARSDYTNDSYKEELCKFYNYDSQFFKLITYIKGDYDNLAPLKHLVDKNTIYYMATPPEIYIKLIENLKHYGYSSIILEKPFAENLQAFKNEYLKDNKILFLDHYLANPLVLALPIIYKNNIKFYNLLNNEHIYFVEAYFNETLGAEGRNFFNKYGIIKDVMQNHLITCLLATINIFANQIIKDESAARADLMKKITINEKNYN